MNTQASLNSPARAAPIVGYCLCQWEANRKGCTESKAANWKTRSNSNPGSCNR